jgi:transcriptional regulator with XRE-family HTH domain
MHRNRTQEAVYLATGIPRSTYQAIERGTTDARISDLMLIAHEIRVPLAELVTDGSA